MMKCPFLARPTSAPRSRSGLPFATIAHVLIGMFVACSLDACHSGVESTLVRREMSAERSSAVDSVSVPLIGSPNARFIVTMLFDYQCRDCQRVHLLLDEIIRRYQGGVAFALCPAPLNSQCNPFISRDREAFKNSCELAKIGLAVWAADHEAFSEFNHWMFTFDTGDFWRPRKLDAARAKAAELLGGQARFDEALANPWVGSYLNVSVQKYGMMRQKGNSVVPTLIYNEHWVAPDPQDADDLVMILQKSLLLPPP